MTVQQTHDRAQQLAHGREVLAQARRESERIEQVLARSRRVRDEALPVLKRAGYLR